MNAADSTQPPVISAYTKPARYRWLVWIIAAASIVLAVVLFAFNPEQSNFYPLCVFKNATGWSCPACGCLRATHQLLHGHLAAAFHLNALFIIALPIGGLLAIQKIFRRPVMKKPGWLGWTLLVAFILFGILRNLPPFLAWSGQ